MILIFGGAFNPVHNEHVNMIKHLLTRKEVEKVVILPSNNPPHKDCPTSFEQRKDMLKLALNGVQNIEICDYEARNQDKHYTCETLPVLKKMYGDIAFVIGGDSLEAFDRWKNPQDIIKICPLYVFSRGQGEKFAKALEFWRSKGAKITVCDYNPCDISSTLIRYNIMLGNFENIDDNVKDYIISKELYNGYKPMLEKLNNVLISKTYSHALRTTSYALMLNYKLGLGLDYDKVFLAAILHDCAKNMSAIEYGMLNIPEDSIGTPVEHQFLGVEVAKQQYGIVDDEILQAIKYHTTGKPNMSALQKLIFCSDMLEPARDFDGVQELRNIISESLDEGYKACALHQYEYLKSKGGDIYPLTTEAVKEFI